MSGIRATTATLFHLIILKTPMLHFQNPSQMFPEVANHLRPIEIILHFSISQYTCLANKKYGPLKRLKADELDDDLFVDFQHLGDLRI
jgi:hypothetical protein